MLAANRSLTQGPLHLILLKTSFFLTNSFITMIKAPYRQDSTIKISNSNSTEVFWPHARQLDNYRCWP